MSKSLEIEYTNLIKSHEGIIHKVIGLYVDHQEDKKDLFQEIMLQGWKSFKNFKKTSLFSTWLYRVSLNTVLNFNKKRKIVEDLDVVQNKADGSYSENLDETELLYRIVRSLNEIDKMLMTLHLEGYKNKEIAGITGMTQNHINVKLHRLKQTVVEQFKAAYNGK